MRGYLIRSGLFSEFGLRFFRRLGWAALVLALLASVVYAGMWLAVRHKERQAEAAWAALDTKIIAPGRRFARPLTSPAAAALDKTLDPVGLSPKPLQDLPLLRATPWNQVMWSMHLYFEVQLETPGTSIDPADGPVADFMAKWAPTLEEARAQILSEMPPRWAMESETSKRGIHINFYLIHGLAEWLLADALQAQLRGDGPRVAADLEAAWVLVELLLEWPHTHAQSVAAALARTVAGTLRKVDADAALWEGRLDAERFRTGLESALALYGHGYLEAARHTADLPLFGRKVRRERMFWKIYGRLWYRYSMADASLKTARELEAFLAIGECGQGALEAGKGALHDGQQWGAIGKAGLPNFGLDWDALTRLRLDFELTRKVVKIRQGRLSDGRWPPAVPGIGDSECPGTRWSYTVREDGSVRLALSEGPKPFQRKGAIDLPVVFQAPGPSQPVIEISGSN